jgi:hypothetical protein
MRPVRLWFAAIVVAFLVWVLYALVTDAAGTADPAPTDSTTTSTTDLQLESMQAELDSTKRQLQAVQKARVRERRGFRTRLRYVIHSSALGGSWLERAFLCIHAGEGSWSDPNPPYWGGIQMDRSFMATYMPWAYRAWGTADNWPASVQVAAGIHAWVAGRGFYPWPNTARACGLIR